MADWVRLAHYPFLPGVREAVREAGVDLATLLESPRHQGARDRAAERVEAVLGSGTRPVTAMDEVTAREELLAVGIARMLLAQANERTLNQRYAAAEARRVHDELVREKDPVLLETAAKELGIPLETDGDAWKVHVSAYMRYAPLDQSEWKLIRRTVVAGMVPLDFADVARLTQEALRTRLAGELDAERGKPLPPETIAALRPLTDRLAPKLEAAKASWTTGDFGPVQPGLFPPCVKSVFEALSRGENLPHHARFAFTTFLRTVGWGAEQIMDYLASTPNFDREKSRYQIEHITGERGVEAYMVPNCSTMQTNGVCPLERRDGLCMKIKNPLSYYRVKTRDNPAAKPQTPEAVPAPVGGGTPPPA